MILAPALYADLIGKPFRLGARGPEAYDCVGLALEVARRRGRALPGYLSSEEELHRQLAQNGAVLGPLARIARPRAGAIVLLRLGDETHHVGVAIDPWRMLHTSRETGALLERMDHPLWRGLILGYYDLGEPR